MDNKRQFDYLSVTNWHDRGITGRGVSVVMIDDECEDRPWFDNKLHLHPPGSKATSSHGMLVADIMHIIAPDAAIHAFSKSYAKEALEFCIEKELPLLNLSAGGSGFTRNPLQALCQQAAEHTLLVTSAGNAGEKGLSDAARDSLWTAVGEAVLRKDGTIVRAMDSSIGPELAVMGLGGFYAHNAKGTLVAMPGTSFAAPVVTGMLALYTQWFRNAYGRQPIPAEMLEFMYDNCIDMEELGPDPKTGRGLFVLPDPASLPELRKEDKSAVNKPEYIVIHHSATAQGDAASFRRYHLSLGWLDIGYHYVINNGTYQPDGLVETGRSEDREGAHCTEQAMNRRSIGVCLVGDFDQDKPTEKQMESLLKLCCDLMAKYNIPVERVIGHREAGAPKTCPGKNFNMEGLRNMLKTGAAQFKDVPSSHWARADIEAVAAAGIMSGYPDGRFGPDEPVTRAQLAAIISRLRRG